MGAARFNVKTGHPFGWRAELIRSAKCVGIPGAQQDGPVQSETRAVLWPVRSAGFSTPTVSCNCCKVEWPQADHRSSTESLEARVDYYRLSRRSALKRSALQGPLGADYGMLKGY